MDPTDAQLAELDMTKEQWSALTKQEQEALLIDDSESGAMTLEQAAELEAAQKALGEAGEAGETAADGKPSGAADDAGKAGAAAGEAAGDQSKAAGDQQASSAVQGEDADLQIAPPVLAFTQEQVDAETARIAKARGEAEAKSSEIEKKLDGLDAQLDAGDITTVEYNKAKRVLDREMLDVARAQARADAEESGLRARVADAQAAYRAALANSWAQAQRDFFGEPENAILYGDKDKGAEAKQHFAQQAQLLASLPENKDRGMTWFLREADRRARGIMGAPRPAQPNDPLLIKGKDGQPARKPRSADLSGVPPSLGTLPAASRDTPQGEFAEIDSLKGEAYLAALDRMTEEQRERYTAAL